MTKLLIAVPALAAAAYIATEAARIIGEVADTLSAVTGTL